MPSTKFKGRAWVILDEQGEIIDDIDTDMIFHNSYLAITEIEKMGQYTFDNLEGYKDFAQKAKPGDLVFVGANFGSGSSRQQAVGCFRSLGVSCIVANSYGAIYKRNAINSGFPILTIKDINFTDPNEPGMIKSGDELEIDLEKATIHRDGLQVGTLEPFSKVQKDIYMAGDIFEYAKEL